MSGEKEKEKERKKKFSTSPAFLPASQAYLEPASMSHLSCFLHESPQYWMSHLVTFVNSKAGKPRKREREKRERQKRDKKNTRFSICPLGHHGSRNSVHSFSSSSQSHRPCPLFHLSLSLLLSFHSLETRAVCNLILILIQFPSLR